MAGVSALVGGAATVAFGPATPAVAAERTCDAAVALAKGGGDDALRVAAELLENQGWSAAQIATCLAPAKTETEYTGVSLGELWKAFSETVQVLAPILVFVGLFALALLVLARLFALLPRVRNMRSMRSWRVMAWIVGLGLAVVVPAYVSLRGMWVMAQGGPVSQADVDGENYRFEQFVPDVLLRSGAWWGVLLVAALTVALLTFAFATRQGVTIKLKSKDDGKSLDTAHIMAAIDGMAGRTNRGLEFPVGTDLTSAAAAVSELSDNKFVATLQVAVSAILGSTPWTLTVENEGENAASVTISRNGALMKAKRVKIGDTLADVSELTSVELLAALIGGELIATLRTRYRSEFDADLSGATDGESIALHYIASSALSANRAARAKGIPILARAVDLDPQNRAAWTTLANYAYRDPKFQDPKTPKPHEAYREFLDGAILEELRRGRNLWDVARTSLRDDLRVGRRGPDAGLSEFVIAQRDVRMWRMKRNGLLVRLLQTRVVAAVNADAANRASSVDRDPADVEKQAGADAEYVRLRRETFGGPPSKREPRKTAIRRRQLLLLDEFRAAQPDVASLEPPEILYHSAFVDERLAWEAVALRHSPTDVVTSADRVACEEAALGATGNYARDPVVAYSLACLRVTQFATAERSRQ